MDLPRLSVRLLPAAMLLLLAGCGAGIVGVVAGSGGGGSSSSSRVPTLRIIEGGSTYPLAPAQPPLTPLGRFLIVNNLQIPGGADLRFTLEAAGEVDVQDLPLLVDVEPANNSSTVAFNVNIANIARVVSKTAADVDALLRLFVDGRQVAPPAPFTLIRQRVATIDPPPPAGEPFTISAAGNSQLRFRLTGRPNEEAPTGVQIEVGVQGLGFVPATEVRVQLIGTGPDWEITGLAPPSAQPCAAFPSVIDPLAGKTEVVRNVYFRPAIQGVSPAFGSTDGGTLVTLVGQGLVPLTNAGSLTSPPDFSRVSIEFERGGRRLEVPAAQLRSAQSSLNQLVFTVPPSPDGRPGPAQVTVTVEVPESLGSPRSVRISDTVPDAFTYRRPAPGFGPRGALLTGAPIAVEPGTLQGGAEEGLDLVVLTSTGGLSRTEVLVAEQNGLFSSFGPPVVSGQQTNPGQTHPVDLCNGDFDGDGDTDAVVINKGEGYAATHSWLERNAAPEPLLSLSPVGIDDIEGDDAICVRGDFDGDSADDIVLLPAGASTAGPRIVLSLPAGGVPSFGVRPLNGPLSTLGPVEVATAADVDGDGVLDLVCFTGGTAMRVIVAYGDGLGSFVEQHPMAVAINGYTPDPASPALGVHAVETGGQLPIALVLAGVDMSSVTPPTVAVLRPVPQQRGYQQPVDNDVRHLPADQPLVAAAFGELVLGGVSELVVARAEAEPVAVPVPELRLLVWFGNGPYGPPLTEVFKPGLEPLEEIRSLSIGLAVPADGRRITEPINGVFVDHRRDTVNGPEDRISTWLVAKDLLANPFLVPPDASVAANVQIEGLALGNFSGQIISPGEPDREARDCCVSTPLGLGIYANGGVGDLVRPVNGLPVPVVPGTLTALDIAGGRANAVAFFTPDGRLGFWDPSVLGQSFSSVDLRTFATDPSWAVSSTSRLLSGDVDGDGYDDLVAVLVLEASGVGPYETVILVLRGVDVPGPGVFPFHEPNQSLQVPKVADEGTSAVLGDFAMGSMAAPELAVAFPHGLDRVRFYRYEPGGTSPNDDRFVWSFAEAGRTGLIAGDGPAQLLASDLDGNLTVDLVVASGGDSKVRVFLNTGVVEPSAPEEVNIAAFFESQGTPALPPGEATAMLGGDFDGDEVIDVMVITMEETQQEEEDYSVSLYLSSGTGGLRSLRILSGIRTGNDVTLSSGSPGVRGGKVYPGLADVNYDGQPDLVLGWERFSEEAPRNLRVLFAGAR